MSEAPNINTPFASVDAAHARAQLYNAEKDRSAHGEILTSCFCDGSRAASEAAAAYLRQAIWDKPSTDADAEQVAVQHSAVLATLSTAVPARNSAPLADITAHLAISFAPAACRRPLDAFVFADSPAKHAAVQAVLRALTQRRPTASGAASVLPLRKVLPRVHSFFAAILADATDPAARHAAVAGLCALPTLAPSTAPRATIALFLLSLQDGSHLPTQADDEQASNNEADFAVTSERPEATAFDADDATEEHTQQEMNPHFQSFLTVQIASLCPSGSLFSSLLLRTVLQAAHDGFTSPILSLIATHRSKVLQNVVHIGHNAFLSLLATAASTAACRGELSAAADLLELSAQVLSNARTSKVQPPVHAVVLSALANSSTSFGSVCAAAGTSSGATTAANVLGAVRISQLQHQGDGRISDERDATITQLDGALMEAARIRCHGAVFCLALSVRLIELWHKPREVKAWVDDELTQLVDSRALGGSASGNGASESGGLQKLLRDDDEYDPLAIRSRNGAVDEDEDPEGRGGKLITQATVAPLVVVSILVTCLRHESASVRLAASVSLGHFTNVRVMLFTVPRVLACLQAETDGIVATSILQNVLCSEGATIRRETAIVAIGAILQLLREASAHGHTATVQTCLVAVARAARFSPGIATGVLQVEADKLRGRLEDASAAEREAVAAAVLALVRARPARGTHFVPLISSLVARKSANACPQAAALCLDAMREMAAHGVLDAAKAVKVVLKHVSRIEDVAPVARRAFLRLLGQAADAAESKKGRVVAEKVIALLRAVVTTEPVSEKSHTAYDSGVDERDCASEDSSDEEKKKGKTAPTSLSWDDIAHGASALACFSSEDVLRIAFCRDEPSIDLEAEQRRLDAIQDDCANFAKQLLKTVTAAGSYDRYTLSNSQDKNCGDRKQGAAKALQLLLEQLTRHEWENRIRGNFDPERIAKLRATADALRRARRARGEHTNAGGNDEDEDDETVDVDNGKGKIKGKKTGGKVGAGAERRDSEVREDGDGSAHLGEGTSTFRRAVESTPNGLIRAVYDAAGKFNVAALRAAAAGSAVSPALPWAELAEDGLRGTELAVRTACIDVLRCGTGEDFAMSEARKRWLGTSCRFETEEDVVEVALAIAKHFPERMAEVLSQQLETGNRETENDSGCHVSRICRVLRAACCVGGNEREAIANGILTLLAGGKYWAQWSGAEKRAVLHAWHDLLRGGQTSSDEGDGGGEDQAQQAAECSGVRNAVRAALRTASDGNSKIEEARGTIAVAAGLREVATTRAALEQTMLRAAVVGRDTVGSSGKNRPLAAVRGISERDGIEASEETELLAAVGKGVGDLPTAARSATVCELASSWDSASSSVSSDEEGRQRSRRRAYTAAVIAARAVGTGAVLPRLVHALAAAQALCESGERVALRRLARRVVAA